MALKLVTEKDGYTFTLTDEDLQLKTRRRFMYPPSEGWIVDESREIVAACMGGPYHVRDPRATEILVYVPIKYGAELIKVIYSWVIYELYVGGGGSIGLIVNYEHSIFPPKFYEDEEYADQLCEVIKEVLVALKKRDPLGYEDIEVLFPWRDVK